MLENILKIDGSKILKKENQKTVIGGVGGCVCPENPISCYTFNRCDHKEH